MLYACAVRFVTVVFRERFLIKPKQRFDARTVPVSHFELALDGSRTWLTESRSSDAFTPRESAILSTCWQSFLCSLLSRSLAEVAGSAWARRRRALGASGWHKRFDHHTLQNGPHDFWAPPGGPASPSSQQRGRSMALARFSLDVLMFIQIWWAS
jgi:hypothetical protein